MKKVGKGGWERISFTRMKATMTYSVSQPTILRRVTRAVAGTIPVKRVVK